MSMFRIIRDLSALSIAIVEIVLIFRFVLRMLAANPQSEFVAWVYEVSVPLLAPFQFAFPTPSVRGGFALEFSTLFAIFAYAFIGYIIQEAMRILENSTNRNQPPAQQNVQQ